MGGRIPNLDSRFHESFGLLERDSDSDSRFGFGFSKSFPESSAGKIPDYWDQVGVDSLDQFLGSRTDSGFVRLRPEKFGSRTK